MGLLEGRVVLITGAGNGIGRAHALACARAGARVVVNDAGVARDGSETSLSPAESVVAEIVALGGEAAANGDSVTDPAGCARMVDTAIERWGRLDGVVNNAGILRDRTFAKMSAREWDAVLDVHLNGTKNVCAAAIASLSRAGGAIVNTTSVSGMIGNFGQANYAAAKAGIYGFTRVLALELRRAGVTANCVAPVAITRMTADLPQDRVDPSWTAERIAPLVVYLLSPLAQGVTGKVFGVVGQRIHAYEVQVNEGVTKPGDALWTPEEIAAQLDDILDFQPHAPGTSPPGPDHVSAVFDCFPLGFQADQAAGWRANIQWRVEGGVDQTLLVADGAVRVVHGLEGQPTCTVRVDRDTLLRMFQGELEPRKAFLSGKASADDFSDLLRMSSVFDFARVGAAFRERTGVKPPAPTPEAAPTGPRVWPIGKVWDGGYFFAHPEHIAAYADATGDQNPAYEGPNAIAPPMFHVRLMKPLLFQIANDPELGLDMLRLVHGEHEASFHRPIRPMDLVQVRGRLLDVQEKASGIVVTSGLYGFVEGELVVECRTVFFIRAPAKDGPKPEAERPPAPPAVTADYVAEIRVPADASLVYARASLDDNPIHTDPATARAAGLPDIILQGLCTMAMTVREGVRHGGGNDPTRLRYAGVRFARPVRNGSALSTIGWMQPDGSWNVETFGPDGKPVITRASLRFGA